jgi:hypothetical protein
MWGPKPATYKEECTEAPPAAILGETLWEDATPQSLEMAHKFAQECKMLKAQHKKSEAKLMYPQSKVVGVLGVCSPVFFLFLFYTLPPAVGGGIGTGATLWNDGDPAISGGVLSAPQL